ncbi:M48 family metalloprotease [bacterium]|nr:M48 family metalloprotease [bacterium]
MKVISRDIRTESLPRLGTIDLAQLWESIPLTRIAADLPGLDRYEARHDEWTEKIRIIGLDGGLLVDYRLLPGLDRLFEYLYSQAGWARPEVYVVSDLGRKGVDAWSAISVVSNRRPIMLLGTQLVENLNEVELAFVIGHETGHLLGYSSEWRRDMSMGFLIRDLIDSDQEDVLNRMGPGKDWRSLYRQVMGNCQRMESRCDRIGLLMCGDWKQAATALLSVALKSADLARSIDLEKYLAVQVPLLVTAPVAGPINMNAGHPFIPFRINALLDFVKSGHFDSFLKRFAR